MNAPATAFGLLALLSAKNDAHSSPPLVLLHRAGTNLAMWIRDIAAYNRLFGTYAVDLLGEAGRSAAKSCVGRSSLC